MGIDNLSLYEKQDAAIRRAAPEAPIKGAVYASWNELINSFFASSGPLAECREVLDRRATKAEGGIYHVFCTIRDGDGKQVEKQIADFTPYQQALLEKIFTWKVAEGNSFAKTAASTTAVPTDLAEIQELLKRQAENLDKLGAIVSQVQQDSQQHFGALEGVLEEQDKNHTRQMEKMKEDYDKQLFDLLQKMKEQHENFMQLIDIKLDGGDKEREIARLKLTVELQEKFLKRVGNRVRFMDGSFERLWEELLQRENHGQGQMNMNLQDVNEKYFSPERGHKLSLEDRYPRDEAEANEWEQRIPGYKKASSAEQHRLREEFLS